MAGDVVDQIRQQGAKCGAAHRPAVDKEHVRAGTDPAVGDLTGADVEQLVGSGAKKISGFGSGQSRHHVVLSFER